MTIQESGPQKMKDIGKAIGITSAAMTCLSDRLVRMKLISRGSAKDRRITYPTLTLKARTILEQFNTQQTSIKP